MPKNQRLVAVAKYCLGETGSMPYLPRQARGSIRAWLVESSLRRARVTPRGSTGARATPGPWSREASTSPQGSTIMAWPQERRRPPCSPTWAAANT